jgi:hypothetical protein
VHPGLRLAIASGFLAAAALAAPKPHTINFGKWTPVKWCLGPNEGKCLDLKVRALYVDGRMKEYMLGTAHDVTERLFVIRRAFRVNDTLPGETAPRWVWQRGGWLAVERRLVISRPSIYRSSIPIIPRSAGTATMRLIAAFQMTARNCTRLCFSWGGAKPY